MGLLIDRSEFSDQEYVDAGVKLRDNLKALKLLLDKPGFGHGEFSIGAELEMSIVDDDAQALPLNRSVLEQSLDPNLQLELDRFNLEYNLSPVPAKGRPFAAMEAELSGALAELNKIAATFGGRIIPIGILPTLRMDQLQADSMTDLERYKALQAGIKRIRKEDFRIRIDGADPLDIGCDSVTVEGANTSFQVHLRVNPHDFAACYNAAQLVTPLALAVSANSPFFLEHSLWDETRIALFKQSVDTRVTNKHAWRRAARVPFGHGWSRQGAFELFAESCHLYPMIIPLMSQEDPLAVVRAGGIPELQELRLQQGTIWNWNRAVYDASAGGHLRIEFRALPSGPTPIDLMANAAYLVGLTVGLKDSIDTYLPAFPFRYAEYNFYRAAQTGLDAELLWPDLRQLSPRAASARDLCMEMMPTAERGLDLIGVDAGESQVLLGLIRERLASGTTPARWLRRTFRKIDKKERSPALAMLVEKYLSKVATDLPVSQW